MKNIAMTMANKERQDRGFVLPYVLVVIAILAIAGTIAAQRLQKASEIVADMQDRAKAERLLISAEAAATYSILTGNAVTGGYDLSPQSPIVWEFGLLSADGRRPLRADEASGNARDVWQGNGEMRRYDLPQNGFNQNSSEQNKGAAEFALVSYRDATGLISLNQGNPNLLLPIFEAVGASRPEALALFATLVDYTDADDNRRQNGAERFDYRTRKLPPPPNAPLRSYAELGHIIGWSDAVSRLDMNALKDMTTLRLGPGYRQGFAADDLKYTTGLSNESILPGREIDVLEQIELNNTQPSQLARFTLWAPRGDGRYQKRVVDIERFLGGVGEPYRRYWVYDSTVLESDFVVNVDPSARRQNGPPQFDELDHVVHASALRP